MQACSSPAYFVFVEMFGPPPPLKRAHLVWNSVVGMMMMMMMVSLRADDDVPAGLPLHAGLFVPSCGHPCPCFFRALRVPFVRTRTWYDVFFSSRVSLLQWHRQLRRVSVPPVPASIAGGVRSSRMRYVLVLVLIITWYYLFILLLCCGCRLLVW